MYTGAAIMGLPLLWMLLCFLIFPPLKADKILMALGNGLKFYPLK
jgi:hypothetical protein